MGSSGGVIPVISDLPSTIPATLRATAARHPDVEAIVDADVRLTYRDLDRAVLEAGRALIGMGVAPGDRVAIWAQNCWQWCVIALATATAGAVCVPINTRFRGGEAAQLIRDSQAVALFTSTGFLDGDYPAMLRLAAPDLDALTTVVMVGRAADGDLSWDDFVRKGAAISESEILARAEAVTADDMSDVVYTSGTTGFPKGVVQTHGNVIRATTALSTAWTLTAGDRNLTVIPLTTTFGLRGGLHSGIIVGATLVLESVFSVTNILDVIERERITILPGPPTILDALLSPAADDRDLSSLRVAFVASTVVPEELIVNLFAKKIFRHVLTGWGLTEACGPVALTTITDTPALIASTAGKVVEQIRLKVVDERGASLPPGTPGRLLVHSPYNMKCYLGDPARTAEVLDADGWLDTGDVGTVDELGYVRITGRSKDMVIVGGFNVYPAEVEVAIRTHPGVQDVAIVGMPDARLGEVTAAFIVAPPGG
ncbi:AMP-binding protein [Mycolicibacterium sp. CH28]|uniref:AMP-binding protein n=1 Tax=Mycolicibacterium sp. CH28 TaxID=2512237 RepID=UPI0013874660|nr:AMP-binding protein [Mycolicibacterium sp. CH28]